MCIVHNDLEMSPASGKVGGFVLMQRLAWGQGSKASDSTTGSSYVLQQQPCLGTVITHPMI